jgi:hypothetical protein
VSEQLATPGLVSLSVQGLLLTVPGPFDPNETVPVGVVGPLLAVSVTVAVHVVDCPTAALPGEQFTAVEVGCCGAVILPTLLALPSVNQSAPSGPAVIPKGALPEVGIEYSVTVPAVVTRPILLPLAV